MKRYSCKAFTLIELLIVVAIIGILAAIAVPNFLNAQVRAKIARVDSDLRTLAVAMDSYRIDRGAYPPDWIGAGGGSVQEKGFIRAMYNLTTPVAYLSSVDLSDPFYTGAAKNVTFNGGGYDQATYRYFCYRYGWGDAVNYVKDGYAILSYGPDKIESYGEWCGIPRGKGWDGIYSSSNGLRSMGDIVRAGGAVNVNGWQQ